MLSLTYLAKTRPLLFERDLYFDSNPLHWGKTTNGFLLPFPLQATSIDWDHWDLYVLDEYQDERDIAISKAWANVDISSIQALASLGELPETLHWMASLMKRMISILRAFTQKRILIEARKLLRSGTSVIDAMSELWLEMRYAVRPLIFDMNQAMEAWNFVLEKSDRFTARGFHRLAQTTSTDTFDVSYWSIPFAGIVSRVQTTSANFRAGVLFTVDHNLSEFRSVWGLDQPFETIWELIPFSFIIDWFFSVGHVISSWTANPGLYPLTSFVTEEHSISIIDTLAGITPTTYYVDGVHCTDVRTVQIATASVLQVTKRRIPTPGRSILPTFNLNLDTAKLIDLATIGRNLYSALR
jgi:KaiC/GvpD/RAD55 family RecA-like ATPase